MGWDLENPWIVGIATGLIAALIVVRLASPVRPEFLGILVSLGLILMIQVVIFVAQLDTGRQRHPGSYGAWLQDLLRSCRSLYRGVLHAPGGLA